MARRRLTGGGIFYDPITSTYTSFGKGLLIVFGITVLALIAYGIAVAVINSKKPSAPSTPKSYPVAPSYSDMPGRIKIADILQAPSSGQAVVYFSRGESEGTTCDTCSSTFDITVSYSGGDSYPDSYKKLTNPTMNGALTFDYAVESPGNALPTKANITIVGRSVSSKNPNITGGPVTFKKTLPYV